MKISIITITYNSEKTLENTILSVINQDYEDIEYIIVDGKSTDRTLDIIEKYKSRINIVVSEIDKGISDAFNKGIQVATGDIIGIINSDDMLAENAVSKLVNCAKIHLDSDVFYGDAIIFNDSNSNNYILKPKGTLSDFNHYMVMIHSSTFVKASAYDKYGLFSLDYKCAMDYELLSKMYFKGAKCTYCNEILTWFRVGGTSFKRSEITINETIQVAVRNGYPLDKAKINGNKSKNRSRVIAILNKFRIEHFVRRVIQKQKQYQDNKDWPRID